MMLEKYKQLLDTLKLNEEHKEERSFIYDHMNRSKLHIAFLGKFSAGKSYLINELVGRKNLLPTKVMETTAIVTEVSDAQDDLVNAEKLNGMVETIHLDNIQTYIHGNNGIESISKLKVTISNSELPEDIVLVDTPGRNTIHTNHIRMSEDAILDAEAAVYVLSAAALSKEDLLYLKHISQIQPNLYFVLNKIDRLLQQDEGEDLSDVISRLESELSQSLGIEATVFPVSAKEGLGIKDLREELFSTITKRFNELKEQAAEQRLQNLVQNVKEYLTNELHFINKSIEQGIAGLEEERQKILDEKEKIERLIENERLDTLAKWREVRQEKRNELEQLKVRLKQMMFQQLPNIGTKAAVENLALQIQEDIISTRKEFMNQTISEMKEKSNHDLQLQIAEIEKHTNDLHIPKPSVELLEQYQKEQLLKLASEVEGLQQKYNRLYEESTNEGRNLNIPESQLRELEDELITLKSKLDIPYVPQFVERERADANHFQEIFKGIGQVADIAVMLIPIAGQAKAGATAASQGAKIAAKEGAKQAAKQSMKEAIKIASTGAGSTVAKEAAIKAAKKAAEKTGEQVLKETALKAIKLLSFEGLGEKIGASIDSGRDTTIQIEDEEYRRQFFLQQHEIQMAYVRKERELKRVLQEKGKQQDQIKQQENLKRQLEVLKMEKEKELTLLREKQQNELEEANIESLKTIAEEKIVEYINQQIDTLGNWLTAESYQIENAVSTGLQEYYKDQFQKIDQQLNQVEQIHESQSGLLLEQKSQMQEQIDRCEKVLGVLV